MGRVSQLGVVLEYGNLIVAAEDVKQLAAGWGNLHSKYFIYFVLSPANCLTSSAATIRLPYSSTTPSWKPLPISTGVMRPLIRSSTNLPPLASPRRTFMTLFLRL